MDKREVKCNANVRPNYFPVNVSILAVVFRELQERVNKAKKDLKK